jgi:hypothetical protein
VRFATKGKQAKEMLKRDLLGERPPDLLHPAPATALTPAPTPMAARLTDEKWERIKPLMPPQKPPTGGQGVTTARYWRGCCGSSELVPRGETYRKRSSGRGERYMVATANGARKVSGSA